MRRHSRGDGSRVRGTMKAVLAQPREPIQRPLIAKARTYALHPSPNRSRPTPTPWAVKRSLTAPGPRYHLPCMPERLVGVSQKDLQAPISVLRHGDITINAQIGRRVKRGPIAPTPPTGHLRDMPEDDVRNP